MLRALTEAGIVPDLVVGSSAGALNAVAYAADPSPVGLAALETLWLSMRRRSVARFSARTLARAVVGRADGLFPNTALRDMITSAWIPRRLQETAVPVHVVAADLHTGEPVVLSSGDAVQALLASTAFPGLYPPVMVGGRLLFDGGVAADAPVLQAEALGADVTYLLPAATADVIAVPRGPLPLAYHALGHVLESAVRKDLAAARGTVHVLPATSSSAGNPVDFRGTVRLMSDGYRLATEWLATVANSEPVTAEAV
jgi:NTE family protein